MESKTSDTDSHYAPAGMYLWDPWFMAIEERVHAFYLQAARDGNHDLRHHNAVSIGHAVSDDLYQWEQQGTILSPGKPGTWDSMALWTGFTLHYGGQYYLFYTGRHTGEFWKQNIGLAISTDLMNFERVSEQPILPHDPELYDTTGEEQNEVGNPPTWRDPYIFKDPQSEDWIMIFSARSNPPGLYNGCIGLARSQNLIDWEIQPPLFAPGHYDELETPQILHYKGLYYLFFSTWDRCYHPDFAKIRTPTSGLHCYVSEDLYGSYRPANQTGIVLGNGENLYSVRMATFLRDRYMAIGWLNFDEKSDFIARLSHPIPMNLDSDRVIADFAP